MTTATSTSVEHCQALLERESITPNDAGCQEYLSSKLCKIGFSCQQFDRGATKNLYATIGNTGPCLLFLGHTDVVPPGNLADWSAPPFAAQITDDIIFGRGAVDMKGSLAAMLSACEELAAQGAFKTMRMAWLITSDEEGDGRDGSKYALQQAVKHGLQADLCLVGEPTSSQLIGDTIKPGRRGSLNCSLAITGSQGHAAYPELAHNPIPAASAVASALAGLVWPSSNKNFPDSRLTITNFKSGLGASNVIPGSASIQFNIRYAANLDIDACKKQITEIINNNCKLKFDCNWQHSAQAFYTANEKYITQISQAIKTVTNIDTKLSTAGGTSDGRFAAEYAWPVVELGLQNNTAHKIDERVSVQDLETLSKIYHKIIRLFAKDN